MSDTHYVTVTCPNCIVELDVTVTQEYDMSYGTVEMSALPLVSDVDDDSPVTTGD